MSILDRLSIEKPLDVNEEIVFEIVKDLDSRRGFSQEWDSIGYQQKNEILEEWVSIVRKSLKQ